MAIAYGFSVPANFQLSYQLSRKRWAEMANKKAHPGFKKVQKSIAEKQDISEERAGAILAASSRGASKAAKKANPRLKKVKS